MNIKFYDLPEEKQNRIINAGFRVFSQNSYKKSPMIEIADAAGISKSLLFHYFDNKLELYLFLWEECIKITDYYLNENTPNESSNLFEILESQMNAKFRMYELYPCMSSFAIKAFYEKEPQVVKRISKSVSDYLSKFTTQMVERLKPEDFIEGLDLNMMYQEIYWASEGYLWEKLQQDNINMTEIEMDFKKLIQFWKKIYLKKEE